MASERALRDEIEQLSAQLKQARGELEVPAEEVLTQARETLSRELEELNLAVATLKERRGELQTRVREEEADTQMARFELTSAQAQIHRLQQRRGCALGAAAPLLVGLLALGRWWLE